MWQLAASLWHQLSAAEQEEWERQATLRHMTGYAWYMSQALRPNPGIYLPLAGGTMSGDIDMDGHEIEDLPAPDQDGDAARKAYVDTFTPLATLAAHAAAITDTHGVGDSIIDSIFARNAAIAAAALGQGARARRNVSQSMANGGPYVAISFTHTDYDNDGMWDPGDPTRLTVQTAGIYLVIAQVHWAAHATGYRGHLITHSADGPIAQWHADPNDVTNLVRGTLSTTWSCLAAEYFELTVWQNSGGPLDVNADGYQAPILSANRIG